MAIIARPGPVFYVFGPKISRTFWGKCTEQSSRKKLAVGGFEPEKVRLLYPAPLKASLLSTTIKVRFLQYFIQNERKSSKIRVIQGLGVVNWTAPRPFFRFQSRKIAKNAGVLLWGLCSAKTYALWQGERIRTLIFGKIFIKHTEYQRIMPFSLLLRLK